MQEVAANSSASASTVATQNNGSAGALAKLYELGAHFVRCDGKVAKQTAWPSSKPRLEKALSWKGPVGIIPASLGYAVVDVDVDGVRGDDLADEVVAALGPPAARVRSKTPGHWHLWYPADLDNLPTKNKWKGGDRICSNAFVVLWHPDELVAQLTEAWPPSPPQGGPLHVAMKAKPGRNNLLYAEASADPDLKRHAPHYALAAAISGLGGDEIAKTLESAAKSDRQNGQAATKPRLPQNLEGFAQALAIMQTDLRYNVRDGGWIEMLLPDGSWQRPDDPAEDKLRARIETNVRNTSSTMPPPPWKVGNARWLSLRNAYVDDRRHDPFLADYIESIRNAPATKRVLLLCLKRPTARRVSSWRGISRRPFRPSGPTRSTSSSIRLARSLCRATSTFTCS